MVTSELQPAATGQLSKQESQRSQQSNDSYKIGTVPEPCFYDDVDGQYEGDFLIEAASQCGSDGSEEIRQEFEPQLVGTPAYSHHLFSRMQSVPGCSSSAIWKSR
jgi:hypothetical protein